MNYSCRVVIFPLKPRVKQVIRNVLVHPLNIKKSFKNGTKKLKNPI